MKTYNRREMIKIAGTAAAGMAVLGLPAVAQGAETDPPAAQGNRKALVIGAHPDDPETCCGGTIALLLKQGWDVVAVYLTRGEAGIAGKSHSEAAAIRTVEAEKSCQVLGCRHIFMNQVDGNTEVTLARYREMKEMIEKENPDVVFTHWPIDSHRDHQVCSILVLDAWRRLDHSFELFYFEAMSGDQSQMFSPDTYVNIDSVAEIKHKSCNCHMSQGMDDIYFWHNRMEQFRGIECHCDRAEAFLHHRWNNEISHLTK